jgi:formylglycine-generating enzyme
MWKWCIVFCLLWTVIGCGGQSEVSEIAEVEVKTDGLADFEERAVTTCKEGLVVEQGYCCWKGQGWSGSSCVGTPMCPTGWSKSGSTCTPPSCQTGQSRVPDGNWGYCCWKGQAFSTSLNKCVGTPNSCPSGLKKTEYGCGDISALGIETVMIPAGSFTMGCTPEQGSDCFYGEKPSHEVTLTHSFALMKTEVTQALYQKVMGENPSHFKGDNRPVESVSWYDAVTFANKLSVMEGRERCYKINGTDVQWTNKDCKGWRLPTEAEWEYAARGGENYKYAGSNNADEVAWYDDNSGSETHPVGQKKANGYGLYDMSGNVYEWVWDWYGEYPRDLQTDPLGSPSDSSRVFRGGVWSYIPRRVRVSIRDYGDPTVRSRYYGFRLGCSP